MQQLEDLGLTFGMTTVDGRRTLHINGPSCVRWEAIGEAYNAEQMHRVVNWLHGRTDYSVDAWLVVETQVRAVALWVLGGKVGYLPHEIAAAWMPLLAGLAHRYNAQITCKAALDPPSAANQGGFGIVVWLPTLGPGGRPIHAGSAGAYGPPPSLREPAPVSTGHRPPVAPPAPPAPLAAPPSPPPASAPIAPVVSPAPEPKGPEISPEELARLKKEIAAAKRELASVEEALDIQSFGFYSPKYGFEEVAQYVARLATIRAEQKRLITDDLAAPCDTTWTVGGSKAEGKKMVRQQAKLMLRAFNGECDAAVAKVKYDNVTTLEERLRKAFEQINKLGEVQRVFVSARYFDLKMAELHLVHEHREKVQEEKEEQKRIREQMKEEQRAQAEIDRAKAEAEKEEAQSAAALAKAQAELAVIEAAGKHNDKLEALVSRLENELKEALDRKAKAIARAQLTKSGHVYVLSNIGSFGEGVYKIGMTRRLEPLERVDELGDASVPFPFDVHAIIYAEDAPGLENRLHRAFVERRVNLVNARKEYFRVTLDEIRVEVEKAHGLVTFLLDPPAEEYRKTLAAATVPPEERLLPPAPEDAGVVEME